MSYQPRPLVTSVNHAFSALPAPSLPRSTFDLGQKNTTTCNAGVLVPIYWEETLPSDTHSITARVFGRLLTSIHPVMDNLYIDWHAFHVPNRLVWDNWQKFMGERVDPDDSIDFVTPVVCDTTDLEWAFYRHGIADYLGFPTRPVTFAGVANDPNVPNAFLHRSIWKIWNEWYRDQNLQDSFAVPTGDGPDNPNATFNGYGYDSLPPRNKRHTYITSALPWPQKGDAVELPLGLTAPVIGNGMAMGLDFGGSNPLRGMVGAFITPDAGISSLRAEVASYGDAVGDPATVSSLGTNTSSRAAGLTSDPTKSGLIADLSSATAATVNSLREAIALQQMLETDARGGTRYVEIIRRDFGAIVPDFRLQRPEYLGGGTSMIDMSAVADTANDLGELGGVATLGARDHFTYSAVEHGHIIIFASIRADLRFQNFIDRRLTRRTRYDYYRMEMAHLGEQPIKNREVFFTSAANISYGENDEIFGYQERFAEYRYRENYVTGMMRSNSVDQDDNPDSLDAWHYALDYDSLPGLNANFIKEDPPIRRTVADQTGPLFKLDIDISNSCTRILPVYSVPGLLRL